MGGYRMKYKIWDHQLNRYSFHGSIFETKEEAIDQLLSFFSADHNPKELNIVKIILNETGEYADMIIKELRECPKCGGETKDKIIGDVCVDCDYVLEAEE